MKEKLTKNLGMKILSLILATLSWIVIVNIDDPPRTRTFRDIVVDIQHEEAIKSLNKIYEVVEGDTVDVTVKGKRSIVDNIRVADIKAVADLSNLSYTNAVPINVTCAKPVDQLTLGKVSTLKVALEDIDSKQFKITIAQKGTEEAGYLISSLKAKPNMIQVSGAKSLINRIDQIRVDVDVSNVWEDFNVRGVPKAYDENGRSIDSSKLTFSSNSIQIYASVLKTKTIPINVTSTGTPLEDYYLVDIDYEPKEVTIAGDPDSLNIDSIPIEVNVDHAYANVEEEIDLSQYIPEGAILAEDSKVVVVKATIEKLQERNISLNTKDIQVKNLPPKMTLSFNGKRQSIKVIGLAKDIKDLTMDSFHPFIDIKNLSEGNHRVKLQMETIDGVKIVDIPFINIALKQNKEAPMDDKNNNNSNNNSNNNNNNNSGKEDNKDKEDDKDKENPKDEDDQGKEEPDSDS